MTMSNEEMAKRLYRKYRETDFARESAAFNAAMEMAKWKDEQYEEEKKDLRSLVDMLPMDEHNQTIIEDLKALLS